MNKWLLILSWWNRRKSIQLACNNTHTFPCQTRASDPLCTQENSKKIAFTFWLLKWVQPTYYICDGQIESSVGHCILTQNLITEERNYFPYQRIHFLVGFQFCFTWDLCGNNIYKISLFVKICILCFKSTLIIILIFHPIIITYP